MTREDIIAMAREAGILPDEDGSHYWILHESELQCFANIVEDAQARRMHDEGMVTVGHMRQQIAVERNKVASWMMAQGYATGHGDTVEDLLRELEWQVRESEREACAKVCEDKNTLLAWPTYADAIRARGQS
jgi:uncharacterized protein YoaH (UPF0181 family)